MFVLFALVGGSICGQEKLSGDEQEISLIESFIMGACREILKESEKYISYPHYYKQITYCEKKENVRTRLKTIENQASRYKEEILQSDTLVQRLQGLKDEKDYVSCIENIPTSLILAIQAIRFHQFLADHSAPPGFRLAFDNRKKLFNALLSTSGEDFNSLAKRYFAFASLKEYLLATAKLLENK